MTEEKEEPTSEEVKVGAVDWELDGELDRLLNIADYEEAKWYRDNIWGWTGTCEEWEKLMELHGLLDV
ncbi:unnamed protein product [marine sediment metagenome]|uniref:Uncharacterized protein n=1 Tax=marine sediment metagenome TaxID=412755 RepID=X1P3C2_9ZZZZ